MISTETELKALLDSQTKGRLEYTFLCKGCSKETKNGNNVVALRTRLEKIGFENFLLCKSCATKLGKSKKSTLESKKLANEKRRKTNLEKYGTDNLFKDVNYMKVCRLKSLGVENVSQLESVKIKKRETCLSHFGVINPGKSDIVQNKRKQTCLQKYGTENVFSSDTIKEKIKSTNRKKYGKDYHTQTDEFRQHLKDIWKDEKKRRELSKKCSSSWSHKSEEEIRLIRSKAHKCYLYQDEYFDSSWELATWIWAKDLGKSIQREPICIDYIFEGVTHKYFPDFSIDNQLVEIKGDHFFDTNGKMICPWDASKNDIYEIKHQKALENNVKFWGNDKIKEIIDYVDEKYTPDFLRLFEVSIPFPYSEKPKNEGDLEIIRHFHRSLNWATKKNKLSPLQAWQNKRLVEKSALNRLKYVGNCRPETVVRGFSVAQIAPRVSVFKPKLAERLIKTYLDSFSEIFDPFSGFSGRLLGTVNCNKRYIGQDINEDHVKESNEIISYKNLQNCSVIQQDLLTDSQKEFECLFTCPPYGGKEHWNENNDEVEYSCDEWIDLCLKNYKCKKYLFVVDETTKYKNNVVETLKNHTLYGEREEYVILI